jgi:hypothetical protein
LTGKSLFSIKARSVEPIDRSSVRGLEALRVELIKLVMSKGVANEKVIKLSEKLDCEIVSAMKADSR